MSEPILDSGVIQESGAVQESDCVEVTKEQPAAKKQKTLTSVVWNDFERIKKKGKMVAVCKHCKKGLVGESTKGTSHLKNHLKICKRRPKPDIRQQLLNVKEKNGVVNVEAFKFDDDRSRTDFANMVILHELPFLFADYVGVRHFVKNLQPLFTIRGRKTVKADCMKVYEEKKVKMYDSLGTIQSRFNLTSDMWTSCQNYGYMSLTAHYIDQDWKLQKRILNFLKVEVPHTAERLSETIMACLMEWNIDRKLFALSLDNCSTNDSMARKIGEQLNERGLLLGDGKFFHIRCACHILNLIVQDGWRVLSCDPKGGSVVEKIRESVKFVTNSQKKQAIFDKVVKEVHISSTISLVRDCPTRWNSTYDMLNIALIYKDAFSRLQFSDKEYKFSLTNEEWGMAKTTSDCLKIFHDVTHMLSGTKYPTSNIFFYHICEINLSILKWEASANAFISSMAKSMRIKFDKYWRTCHSSLAIAAILDPQYKMKLLEYYFPKIYGDCDAIYEMEVIKRDFESLYLEYLLQSPPPLQMATQEENNCDGIVESVEKSPFDEFIQETSKNQISKRDIEYYLDEPVLARSSKFDILVWWKVNEARYPILSQMARDILGIPVSTVPSESVFSTSGRVIDKYRSSLKPETAQALICAQDWLRNDFSVLEKSTQLDDSETQPNQAGGCVECN